MRHAATREAPPTGQLVVAGATTEATPPAGFDLDGAATLPRDHPAWQRDLLAVSSRARAVLAGLQPVIVRVLGFWDHLIRNVDVGPYRLEIDPSGSYRLR